jgi:hypothetical protein
MSRSPDVRTANGSRQFLAGNVPELAINWISTSTTLTAMPAAVTYFGGSNGNIQKVDCLAFEQAKITARVTTVGSAGSVIRLGYNNAFQTVVGSVLQMGRVAQIQCPITALGVGDSGWVDLAPGAQIDNNFITLLTAGGDGATGPVVANVWVMFR